MLFRGNVRAHRLRGSSKPSSHRRPSFDRLEERRLLAGIDVLVFHDSNQSRFLDGVGESGQSGRVLYLDLNQNGVHDPREQVAISNEEGIASFRGLSPGQYAVALLGEGNGSHQTSPVLPSPSGTWQTLPASGDWPSDAFVTPVWGYDQGGVGYFGRELVAWTSSAEYPLDRIKLDGEITEIWAEESETDSTEVRSSGVLRVEAESGNTQTGRWYRFAWGSSRGFEVEPLSPMPGTDAFEIERSVRFGDRWIGFSSASKSLADIRLDGLQWTAHPMPLSVSGSVLELKPAGSDGFVALEQVGEAQRLSMYRVVEGSVALVSERTFAQPIEDWTVSSDGRTLFAQVSGSLLVLDTISGMPTLNALSDSQFPVLEDADRSILYTSVAGSSDVWNIWNSQNWELEAQFDMPSEVPPLSLSMTPSGRSLVSISKEGRYDRDILQSASATVNVLEEELVSIAMGVRDVHTGVEWVLDGEWEWSVSEDESLAIDLAQFASQLRSLDGTRHSVSDGDVYWVITRGPEKGEMVWSTTTGGEYKPDENSVGSDRFWLAAYDGQRLSEEVMVRIEIDAINDPPSDLLLLEESISSEIRPGESVGSVRVVDPDLGDVYDFLVSDPRFAILGTTLYFIQGSLDIESEAFIPLMVTAIARSSSADRLSKWLTLRISDQNDAPSSILFRGNFSVPERTPGATLGDLSVLHAESGKQYEWSVSDARFEVESGKLRLKSQVELDFELEPTVGLTVVAKDRLSGWLTSKALIFQVMDLDDPAVTLSAASEYHVEENKSGDLLGYVYVRDADRNEDYSISVSDDRFEVVRNAFRLRARHALQWVEPGYVDVVLSATSSLTGAQISKGVRVVIDRDQTPYHNDSNPGDVDGDGSVSPLDPLIIVNYINSHGPGTIRPEGEGPTPHMDVDGDGVVSPLDILVLINMINSGEATTSPSSDPNDDSNADEDVDVTSPAEPPVSEVPVYDEDQQSLVGEGEGSSRFIGSSVPLDWMLVDEEIRGRKRGS